MPDVINLPAGLRDILDQVEKDLGVVCWSRNGVFVTEDGQGALVQQYLDDQARPAECLARARAFAKRRIILYAAQQWENGLDDNAEERALDRFATAICATGAADVALGGVLNGGEKPVVQWAYNEMNDLKAWAKSAHDAITRLNGETDLDVLWEAGSDPSSLPEFQ